ncbi:SOS response-associated peptidase family protein [Collibacillus ludicampi]|uniref:SOS response-associated peptidase family protein n=1 Tax=Collibacillus ludicampi TaxID=2771369 RepID=UPI002493DE33|nr:SOS response-associated peptidase family protein [Collibacillus ludicampi]
MCGRFTLTVPMDSLLQRFQVEQIPFDYRPRYNIAPGQLITAVIAHEGKNRIGQLKWGLIPSCLKISPFLLVKFSLESSCLDHTTHLHS